MRSFILDDEKSGGTVTFTRSSATVTGSGTNFLSTDVTRQFKAADNSPIYTITDVASTTSMTSLSRFPFAHRSFWRCSVTCFAA